MPILPSAVPLPAPLPTVRLPVVTTAPSRPPTVSVPLPKLPLVEPSVGACVVVVCVNTPTSR